MQSIAAAHLALKSQSRSAYQVSQNWNHVSTALPWQVPAAEPGPGGATGAGRAASADGGRVEPAAGRCVRVMSFPCRTVRRSHRTNPRPPWNTESPFSLGYLGMRIDPVLCF